MKQLSSVDFSKHVHTVEMFKSEEGNSIRVDRFGRPDTGMYHIRFVTTDSNTSVYGDLGNWVFCRDFIPSYNNGMCAHYFREKLEIRSTQKMMEYDKEETKSDLLEFIKNYNEEVDEDSKDSDVQEWFDELLHLVDEEYEYKDKLYHDMPIYFEPEYLPYAEKCSNRFLAVLDAFNIMCERMK